MLQGWSDTGGKDNDGGPQFAEVFVVYWLGATVVTLNIKLLGGSVYATDVMMCKHTSGSHDSGQHFAGLQLPVSIVTDAFRASSF